VLEAGEFLAVLPGFRLGEDFQVERLPELQPVPPDPRQLVRHRR
jgi:hypothetical protein